MGLSQYMSVDWVIGDMADMGHSYRGSQGSIETHKQTTNRQCLKEERGGYICFLQEKINSFL